MDVILEESKLKELGVCSEYLKSPEWDEGRRALVYTNWDRTVARLLERRETAAYLKKLIAHGLVPMTENQFREAREAHRRMRDE